MAPQQSDENLGVSARRRMALYAFVSVIVAGATAWVVWTILAEYEQQLNQTLREQAAERVVVAGRNLPAGHLIGPDDVTLKAISGLDEAAPLFGSVDDVIGQTTGDRVLQGEPIRMERLTVGGSKPRLDEIVDVGARAVSVRVASDAGVAGLLVPGTFVDVLVTIRPDNDQLDADWVAETILQGVRVLAVNRDMAATRGGVIDATPDSAPRADQRQERPILVTLEVEPAEAEGLALAVSRGQIRLSLRAQGDLEVLESRGPLVTNALLGVPAPVRTAQQRRIVRKREVEARQEQITMEIIRGRHRTVEQVEGERSPPAAP